MLLQAVFGGRPRAHMVPTLTASLQHTTRPSSWPIILTVLLCPFLCGPAQGQTSGPDHRLGLQNAGRLKAEQVVENLVRMNLQRAQALQSYESTRIYRLEYKGFPGGRSAEVVVNMKYRAPETKEAFGEIAEFFNAHLGK